MNTINGVAAHTHEGGTDHPHGADHNHDHDYGPTAAGSVVLDIGGDQGALILITPAELLGAEIDVNVVGAAIKTHVAVRQRVTPRGVQYAAIYPSLAAGEYEVWNLEGSVADRVTVIGGCVAQLDWS